MKPIVLITMLALLASCSNSSDNPLASSDSLAIQYVFGHNIYGDKTITTTDQTAIKKVANYLNKEATKELKCGINGWLLFYKTGRLTDSVLFNYDGGDGCQSFLRRDSKNIQRIKMSNEAAAFLKGLWEGKSWY